MKFNAGNATIDVNIDLIRSQYTKEQFFSETISAHSHIEEKTLRKLLEKAWTAAHPRENNKIEASG